MNPIYKSPIFPIKLVEENSNSSNNKKINSLLNSKRKKPDNDDEFNHSKEQYISNSLNKQKINEKNDENKIELEELKKFEIIKKELDKKIKLQINKYLEIVDKIIEENQIEDKIKEILNNFWKENEENMEKIYGNLNPDTVNDIKTEVNGLEELYKKTYIQTTILPKNKDNNIQNNLTENKNNTNNNNENKNNIKDINIKSQNDKFDNYSFKCLTKELRLPVVEGYEDTASINIELENNGTFPWKKNKTFLITDDTKSDIKTKKIILNPLNPNSKCSVKINYTKLNILKPGIYKNYLIFQVDGKNFGNNIIINIEVNSISKTVVKAYRNIIPESAASDATIIRNIIN